MKIFDFLQRIINHKFVAGYIPRENGSSEYDSDNIFGCFFVPILPEATLFFQRGNQLYRWDSAGHVTRVTRFLY